MGKVRLWWWFWIILKHNNTARTSRPTQWNKIRRLHPAYALFYFALYLLLKAKMLKSFLCKKKSVTPLYRRDLITKSQQAVLTFIIWPLPFACLKQFQPISKWIICFQIEAKDRRHSFRLNIAFETEGDYTTLCVKMFSFVLAESPCYIVRLELNKTAPRLSV